jgi:hypothetical protein
MSGVDLRGKRVAIYARHSSANQREASIDLVFFDKAVSGKRPFGGHPRRLEALAGQVKIDAASRLGGGKSLDAVSTSLLASIVPAPIGYSTARK